MSFRNTPSFVRQQGVAQKLAAARRRIFHHGMLLLILITAAALIYVGVRIDVIRLGYEVNELQARVEKLHEEKNKLEAQVAALKSPSRLERIAGELGMRAPKGNEIVILDEGNGTD